MTAPAAFLFDLNRVFTDANFLPLASGLVYFYEAGTSTPLDTFSTSDLDPAGANTNPIVLNASGFSTTPIYCSAAAYKINVTDANGVQQSGFPRDNVGIAAPVFS